MKLRYTTWMWISESSNQTRSFKIPTVLLWLIIALVIVMLAGTVTGFFLYSKLQNSNQANDELASENLVLLEENQKLQQLEENLKANTILLKKFMGLVGVYNEHSGPENATGQDSAVMELMKNSEYLLNLSDAQDNKEISIVVPSGMPTEGRIIRGFNPEDENISRRHMGIDIVNKEGTKVFATADGMVDFAGWDDTFGKLIILKHAGQDHSEGYQTYYGHNLVNLVSEGEIVCKGDLIALSGNTGRSTGPHLHYEIRKDGMPVDPENYMNR